MASTQRLLERLASPQVSEFSHNNGRGSDSIEKLLSELKTSLLLADRVFNDAQNKRLRDPDVRRWLEDLEHSLYLADDLLDRIKSEVVKLEAGDFDIESKLRGVCEGMRSIAERSRGLELLEGFGGTIPMRRVPAIELEQPCLYGRDSDKEFLLDLLMSGEDETTPSAISVIPIVGEGGIGKSTLAQFVYDHGRVKERFVVRAWVTVSDGFDVFRLTRMIYEGITSRTYNIDDDPRTLQVGLNLEVNDKRFLLVLDGVSDVDSVRWDRLRTPFESTAVGRKIIVTTRDGGVASVMGTVPSYHLRTMSDEDSWKLFVRHAFCNIDSVARPDLVTIGRRIVEKCRGLPLAVKSLGGLLRSEVNAEVWERISRSESWALPERESDILPALWLSYVYLPPHLKRCFAFSSIFPKDYEFEKQTLILLWMAEDLLQPERGNKTMEETGEEYFDELVSRSLFQKSSRSDQRFIMHGLVNDLAMFVSGEFCCRLDDTSRVASDKTRHLSYSRSVVAMKPEALSRVEYLRTFFPLDYSWESKECSCVTSALPEMLRKSSCLRILSLSFHSIGKLPESIDKLKLLRYLDLSRSDIGVISNTICTLHNLQTLLLSSCKNLRELPSDMRRLINLRYLDVKCTPLAAMPPHMGDMADLQVLSYFVLGHGGRSNIKELGRLRNLRGELCISGLENIGDDVGNASEANLMDKKYLSELSLKWGDNIDDADDSSNGTDVLDKLRPHTNLKKLSIDSYKGTSFPDWVASSSFARMTSLRLSKCKNCPLKPALGQLLSLQELDIIGFDEIVEIGVEFCSISSSMNLPFRSLERLRFEDMLKWERWEFFDGSFPRLKNLCLKKCPRLAGTLPSRIETLEIQECPIVELPIDQSFPRLECLTIIKSCDSMTVFELNLFPTLSELELRGCENVRALIGRASSRLRNLKLSCQKLTGCLPATIESLSARCCTGLDVPANQYYVSLEHLFIQGTYNEMTSFPLDHLPWLSSLYINGSGIESFSGRVFLRLRSLIAVFCSNLKIEFGDRFPDLRKLVMTFCDKQQTFPEARSVPHLHDVHICQCQSVAARLVSTDLRGHASLRWLPIMGCDEELDTYPKEGNLPASLTFLRVAGFTKLKALNGTALQQLACLETLEMIGLDKVESLPEDDLPSSLTRLSS